MRPSESDEVRAEKELLALLARRVTPADMTGVMGDDMLAQNSAQMDALLLKFEEIAGHLFELYPEAIELASEPGQQMHVRVHDIKVTLPGRRMFVLGFYGGAKKPAWLRAAARRAGELFNVCAWGTLANRIDGSFVIYEVEDPMTRLARVGAEGSTKASEVTLRVDSSQFGNVWKPKANDLFGSFIMGEEP